MKNLNKVLALLVVFMMMLSTVAFASSFSDVADSSSYSTAIEVGVDLGLIKGYEDGTFKPEGEITRAEFAAIVVRLLGQEAQAEGAKAATQFTDVPADHWAAGYVNIAVQAGVINGYGNGQFGPEDLVEYQDAITMIVRALGYEPAIGAAGYPTGYLTKAGELGITSKVNGTNGVAANRGTVAQIAFNALDVPLMTQSGYGTFTQYVINDGYSSTSGNTNVKKTLLSENHSTVKVQGTIVSSTDATSSSTTGTDKVTVNITDGLRNKFSIGGTRTVEAGDSDAMKYVGKKCVIFIEYDEFENECTVKAIYEVTSSDSVVIDLADVEKYTSPVATTYNADGTVKANGKNGKVETEDFDYTIADNANVYYNGVKMSDVAANVYVGDAGIIKKSGTIELALLDSSVATADYDTIYITAYDVVVVDNVRASASRVTAKAASHSQLKTFSYDETDGKVKATLVDANGAAMDWADLAEYDVVGIKYVKTAAKSIIEAQIINNTVTGTVTEVDESANWDKTPNAANEYKYVSIDGVEYEVMSFAETDKEIKVGDEGTYYLGTSGIVWHEASISINNNYAYVINAVNASDMEDAQIKLLTKDNGIVTVDVASKIYVTDMDINGSGKGYERSTSKLSVVKKSGNSIEFDLTSLIGSLITYKLDASNALTAVEIALDADANQKYDAEDYFSKHNGGNALTLSNYDPDDASFGKYTLTENTVVFDVTDTDKDNWEVVALVNLAEGDALAGAYIYDVDDDDNIGAIVVTDAANTIISGATNAATFVTGTSEAYDEDGVLVDYVKGYVNGEEVVYVSDGVTLPAIGSLVIPEYKANGEVKNYKTVVAGHMGGAINSSNYAVGYYGDTANGNVTQDSTKGRIVIAGTTYKIPTTANVYVYDSTSTSRVKYEAGSYVGRVEYDDPTDGGTGNWVLDDDYDTAKNVKITLYEYDGDIVDVLYYVY